MYCWWLLKRGLPKKWLSPESPTLNAWMDITKEIYKMEQITAFVNHKMEHFALHWEKWTSFMWDVQHLIDRILSFN